MSDRGVVSLSVAHILLASFQQDNNHIFGIWYATESLLVVGISEIEKLLCLVLGWQKDLHSL